MTYFWFIYELNREIVIVTKIFIWREQLLLNEERIFEIRNNSQGTPMKIIRYGSMSDIDIQFMDEYGYIVHDAV